MSEERKWSSPLAREAASQGKIEVAEMYEEYHNTTRSDHPDMKKAYGSMQSFSNNSKKEGIGLPPAAAGRTYIDKNKLEVTGKEYCESIGFTQSPRGKRNAEKE